MKDAQNEGAEDVCLYLVGDTSSCEDLIAKVNRTGKNSSPKKFIDKVDFGKIKTLCTGSPLNFIGKSETGWESVTYNFVDSKYYVLFGIVHENSISCRKLTREEFKIILEMNIDNAVSRGEDVQIAKTVRKLSDNLWVNWKTGRLGTDIESALYYEKGKNNLSPAELRLLSVLVQGEGAVVGWDEIVQRGIRMQEELDDLKSGSYSDNRLFKYVDSDDQVQEPLPETEFDFSEYLGTKEENDIIERALDFVQGALDRGINIDAEEVEQNVKELILAIRKLCRKALRLLK